MLEASKSLLDWIENFDRGKRTVIFDEDGLRYYVNDYWTSRQRQGNGIHEISYRACFKSQLPEFFIDALTNPGDTVYDPFMGRGTTPVQASLMERVPIGNDVNPLSKLLTRPRLNPPTLHEISRRLNKIILKDDMVISPELLAFYHPVTLSHVTSLRAWVLEREEDGRLDHVDDWIRMVAISRLTGHSPGFFSVYTLPPNQATSVKNQKKINLIRKQEPPLRDVKRIIERKSISLLRHAPGMSRFKPVLGDSVAWDTPYIAANSVDLIVTSPPFLDIVQYKTDNWLRCWFAGIDPENIPVSIYRSPDTWAEFVRNSFVEFSRVVQPSGYVAFEVGEVRNGQILLEQYVAKAMKGLPFEILGVIVNQQNFTKTSNCWGIDNNSKGTNTNRIVLIRRI